MAIVHTDTRASRLLRSTRQRTGMTQQQVADAAGMTRSHYSLVELGLSGIAPEKACRLAVILGLTLDELYGREVA